MKASFGLFAILAMTVSVLGCASSARVEAPPPGEVAFRLLTPTQVRNHFNAGDTPSPFVNPLFVLSTSKKYIIAASLYVPKLESGSIDIEELSAYSADGAYLGGAPTKQELIDYWKSAANLGEKQAMQFIVIDKYYLPGTHLEKREMGRDYAVVLMAERAFLPTDKVSVKMRVNGDEKSFDLDVGAASGKKSK
jgi:hypothetical protein